MASIPFSLPPDMLPRLRDAQPQPPQPTNPATTLTESGQHILDAYRRYDELRVLTSLINGLPENAPFPAQLVIDEVVINFRINGLKHSATTRAVEKVGDLYRLLALETDSLIREMRDAAAQAREAAATIEAAVGRSQAPR
jgi:hypothetical protein